ncbi:YpjP family protein [Oceanobacillus sp. 1P07AA]|uniref:YpjP family protein n=1 Tax=Oceanobacillus sp. 1P07AA TaxID=3132293 RepID=UPI0039A60F66
MKIWWRKIAVVLITILTLGMYSPTTLLEVDAQKNNGNIPSSSSSDQETTARTIEIQDAIPTTVEEDLDTALNRLMSHAQEQSMIKFGTKIATKVEDEFNQEILPKIEEVLHTLLQETETAYAFLSITEDPAVGYGERIFNVYDEKTKKHIAKFHVRRDNRPLEGHYFNFHYHLSTDKFKVHHDIGDIYWDKNTPPKWMI